MWFLLIRKAKSSQNLIKTPYLLLFTNHSLLNLNTKQNCFCLSSFVSICLVKGFILNKNKRLSFYFLLYSCDIQILTSPNPQKETLVFRHMKIQCDVCEKAPATLICCADEAALCAKCDIEVHAANKLASKHQRLFLDSLSTKFPPCDICLEKAAFIFCVEDRALLCRDCDEATHAPNTRSANHQRFLATGIRVALSSTGYSQEVEKNHFDPSNQQNEKQILSKPSTQQPDAPSPLWTTNEFFRYSDLECSNKKEQLDTGELDWLAEMGFFSDHPEQEALPAAEVPELSDSHLAYVHSYNRPLKSNVPNKKPRLEIRYDDEEEHFLVPDLG